MPVKLTIHFPLHAHVVFSWSIFMSTSSSSSTSPAEEVQGGDGGEGQGGGGFEGPSSSRRRMRSSNGVWPDPFVEALAFQVAIDASRNIGRLAAAQALFNIFQVPSHKHMI